MTYASVGMGSSSACRGIAESLRARLIGTVVAKPFRIKRVLPEFANLVAPHAFCLGVTLARMIERPPPPSEQNPTG